MYGERTVIDGYHSGTSAGICTMSTDQCLSIPQTRRRPLLLCSLGLIGAATGCTTLLGTNHPRGRFESIYLHNYDWDPHEVHLEIHDRETDSPVYQDEVHVDAYNPDTNTTAVQAVTGFPKSEGPYELRARLDATDPWKSADFDRLPECSQIEIRIGEIPPWDNEDIETPQLYMFPMGPCEETDPA